MNKKKIFIIAGIVALILLSFVSGSTFAKYLTESTTSATLEVAKWSVTQEFLVNGKSVTTSDNVNLANTYDSSTLVNGKIAPGTSGDFKVVIDATGTETGINYQVKFDNITGTKPSNLVFTYNNAIYTSLEELSEGIEGNIPANAENKILSLEIGWIWAYETSDEGDIQDTLDGQNISNYNFDVTITCTQDIPKVQ